MADIQKSTYLHIGTSVSLIFFFKLQGFFFYSKYNIWVGRKCVEEIKSKNESKRRKQVIHNPEIISINILVSFL